MRFDRIKIAEGWKRIPSSERIKLLSNVTSEMALQYERVMNQIKSRLTRIYGVVIMKTGDRPGAYPILEEKAFTKYIIIPAIKKSWSV